MIDPSGRPDRTLDLQVLGAIGLRRGDVEVREVVAQSKRFALLVYLALRRPAGFVRRDELVGMFWPESTERRARASLRQTLRFLRGHLGPELIVNRGDAEVRLASEAVACDGVAFQRAVDAGDDRAAVSLYGGDLLPSFMLPGVYEFDRWLQGERQRLRTAAIQAALRLIAAEEEAGRIEEAAGVARWALHLERTNEAAARRLIALLARAGNRASALEVFETLRQRLSADLDLDPAPETTDLAAAVQGGGVPTAMAGDGGRRSLSRQRILVLTLENLTGDAALSAIGRLAADALAQGLATVSELEVVPPIASLGSISAGAASGTAAASDLATLPGPLMELARRSGAGTVVDGTYYLDGDRVAFRVRITDALDGRLLEGPPPVLAPRTTPARALEELAERVATFLAPALDRRAVHVRKAARPPGLEAYREYLEGLERFIRGEWQPALSHFRRSATLQPGYALPRIVSAIAHWNLGDLAAARSTAEEAAQLQETVGRFERGVLDMVRAWLSGDWAAAHRAARVQADLAPGSIPHFQVAEEARRLNRPREAREVLSLLDPEEGELEGWIFYWIERTVAHHLLGDHGRELELASRCHQLHPDDPTAVLLEVRALAALGRASDAVRLIDQTRTSPGGRGPGAGALFREGALELRAHGWASEAGPLLERAVEWYEERAGEGASDELRRELARSLYDAGRLVDARALFHDLATREGGRVRPVGHHHGHLQAHLDEGYLAVIAARQADAQEAERWCAWLEALDGPFLYGAQWFWRAAVAAVLDEGDRAVTMLRRAFADGLPLEMFLHTDPHLLRLRGHPSLDALMRPRG